MAKTTIFYESESGRAEEIALDAVLSRGLTQTVQVTKFPIEDGSLVADHAIAAPDCYRLEGVVSDAPMATQDQIDSGVFSGAADAARAALSRVLKRKIRVSIVSGSRPRLDGLVMTALTETETSGDARKAAFVFSATFEEVRTVSTQIAPIPKTSKPAAVKGGRKPTEKASDAVKRKASASVKVVDAIRGK